MSSPLNNPPATPRPTRDLPGFQIAPPSRPPSVAGSLSDAGSEREVVFMPVPIMITPEMLERMLERRLPSPGALSGPMMLSGSTTLPDAMVLPLPSPLALPRPVLRSPQLPAPDGRSLNLAARQSPSLTALGIQGAANRVLGAIDLTAASIDTVGTAVETVVDHTQNTIEALRNRSWYQRISAWLHGLPCCRSDSAMPDVEPQQQATQ